MTSREAFKTHVEYESVFVVQLSDDRVPAPESLELEGDYQILYFPLSAAKSEAMLVS